MVARSGPGEARLWDDCQQKTLASSPSEDYLNGACGSATMDRDN